VTGRPIDSVTFFVNGRLLGTLHASPGQQNFTIRPRVTRAVTRVAARVVFAPGATLHEKTLRAVVRRCPRPHVKPVFNG
jgi:hypothetical protein